MREKFELASKIIGLVFWGLGFVAFVSAVLIFILKPDVIQMLPESARAVYNQQQIRELREINSQVVNRTIIIAAMIGVVQILLGVYLMKSNNLFVKICYPFENQNIPVTPSPDIRLGVKSNESQTEPKKSSGDKYAPPGYFQ